VTSGWHFETHFINVVAHVLCANYSLWTRRPLSSRSNSLSAWPKRSAIRRNKNEIRVTRSPDFVSSQDNSGPSEQNPDRTIGLNLSSESMPWFFPSASSQSFYFWLIFRSCHIFFFCRFTTLNIDISLTSITVLKPTPFTNSFSRRTAFPDCRTWTGQWTFCDNRFLLPTPAA